MNEWREEGGRKEGKNKQMNNKTLGRAQDPRASGAWLSKLTE